MLWLKNIVIICCVLLAAATLGNLFMTEVKKARANDSPWYTPYLTIPGLMVLAAVLLVPILLWLINK
jgi:hypothetical protein